MFRRLLLVMIILASFRVGLAQETLVLGQLTTVNVLADTQAPSLTFTAAAGQRLNLQLVSITSGMFPILTIYTADGEILQYVGNPARSNRLDSVAVIPAAGSYRLELWSIDSVPGQIILLAEDLTAGALPPAVDTQAPPALTPTSVLVTPAQASACAIAAEGNLPVNVREGPSTVFRAIAPLLPGESLVVTGRDRPGDWYQVEVRGITGWAAASVTRLSGDCANLEVFAIRIPTFTPTPTPTPTATPTFTPTATPTMTLTPTATP